jgi:hypothetical protein
MCPVLQYDNDTLILVRGEVSAISALRSILDAFSAATGLTINFHRTTFVPLNIPAEDAEHMGSLLGCEIASFPQTYLGLPLTPYKLKAAYFVPLIGNFDRYLAGWKARLLSSGGRMVLVNVVLSSLNFFIF